MIEGSLKKSPPSAALLRLRPAVVARHFDEPCDLETAIRLLREICADADRPGPVKPRQPLALYGAGNLGRLASDHLRMVGERITVVVDRNAATLANDPAWVGIPVLHPDEVDVDFKQKAMLAVSVVTSAYAPLEAELHADGWADVVPFYDIAERFRASHPLSNGWFADPFSGTDIAAIEAVLGGWGDDLSRAHHLQFNAWRRLRQEWTFADAPVTIADRFFIADVTQQLGSEEVFIDAGAHHGSVALRFIAEAKAGFRSITAIEPDAESHRELAATVTRLPQATRSHIAVSEALLDSEMRLQPFHSGLGYASQISKSGKDARLTRTIDSLGLAPTFLKLHLEGGELAALKGGIETLRAHRPIVAATVYHDADGLYATAAWLMQHLENYRFLFRLHSWCGTGAVIYAIPRERG